MSDAAASLSLDALSADPYPTYAMLRHEAPVAWAPRLGMWLVTRYEDVRDVLLNPDVFVTGTQDSLLFDTFGEHMLTTDGALQRRYRDAKTQGAFMPAAVRATFQAKVAERVRLLVDGFVGRGEADLRAVLASRLPVLVMLDVFGLPEGDEALFRSWYDSFEAALANHAHDAGVRAAAAADVRAFHAYFQRRIEGVRARPSRSLLNDFVTRPQGERLTDEQIRRNALIIFFGGISTVEAMILNTLWALFQHPTAFERVKGDRALIGAALDETMRWMSPVQSATRHTVGPAEIAGVSIPAGAVVNCMLASANRDEAVFDAPDVFDIARANVSKHLGFATGPHVCIGRHLAKEEARAAIDALLERAPGLMPAEETAPVGHEFRQPRSLRVRWRSP